MTTDNLNIDSFQWATPDGLKIHAKDWHVKDPKAVVIIIHGLGEHCDRYTNMALFYNKNKIGFVGYDRRGHGQSEGKRGHTISYESYLDEVERLIKETENRYPGKPIFLYGHSMGGNISLNYVIKRNPKIAGLIVSGAWIILFDKLPAFLVGFAKIINGIFPIFTQNSGLDPNNISTEEFDKLYIKV